VISQRMIQFIQATEANTKRSVLINVDHVRAIHPHGTAAPGARIDLGDDLHVYVIETFDEIVAILSAIGTDA